MIHGELKGSIKTKKKKKNQTAPQHYSVAEDYMLLEGGVLYGFTGKVWIVSSLGNLEYIFLSL